MKTIKTKIFYRTAKIENFMTLNTAGDKAKHKPDEHKFELSFSSELPYKRWFGDEILGHKTGEVRMDRLKNGAPVLIDHHGDQIGVVDSASINSNEKKGQATIRLSRSKRGQEIARDIADGIRQNVSVGYRVHEMVLQKASEGKETFRVTDWEPLEISVVGVPADASVGIGRGQGDEWDTIVKGLEKTQDKNMDPSDANTPAATPAPAPAATPVINVKEIASKAAADEQTRIAGIEFVCKKYNMAELQTKAIKENWPLERVNTQILADFDQKNVPIDNVITEDQANFLNKKEVAAYSIVKAIRTLADKKPLDGLEKEASDEVARLVKEAPGGFYVPRQVKYNRVPMQHRAPTGLSAGVSADGGFTIETDLLSLIELLREMNVLRQMGARVLGGLSGNIGIPRQSGPGTATTEAEGDTVAISKAAFDQPTMTPHRVASTTAYSKRLLAQSSIDVEGFVREDLAAILAIKQNQLGIAGDGVGENPVGIMSTAGVNATVTFGLGDPPTWADVVEFETGVNVDNALIPGNLWYLTTPQVKGAWKTTVKVTNQAVFLWEAGNEVNGYPGMTSNEVLTNRVIFGNFRDLIMGEWEGIDIVVDPFTLAAKNEVVITANQFIDFLVRHPESFNVSTDAGNQ